MGTLTTWEEKLSFLDRRCQKLLLFSTQKFLRIYHMLQGMTSSKEMMDFLVKEMVLSCDSYQGLTPIIDDTCQVICGCMTLCVCYVVNGITFVGMMMCWLNFLCHSKCATAHHMKNYS